MKLVPYDLKKLDTRNYRATKLFELLTEFAESDNDCVKVEGWTHTSATSCSGAFSKAIKTFNMTGIKCIVRKGVVYLIKTTTES